MRHPTRFPARQTYESSQALARLHKLDPAQVLLPQQAPEGIDAGALPDVAPEAPVSPLSPFAPCAPRAVQPVGVIIGTNLPS